MITLAEAIRIAEGYYGGTVDRCTEYPDAYLLSDSHAPMMLGGNDGNVVVLKEDGRAMNMTSYFYIRDFKISEPVRDFELTPEDRAG